MIKFSTSPSTLTLAALSNDRSLFADKVRAAAAAGSNNPVFESAKKFPAEYSAWRQGTERQLADRSRFGSILPNAVNGSDVSRAVIFRVGDRAPNGTATIDRASLNRLQCDLSEQGTCKIFVGDDSEFSNIGGSARNFRIADSQLIADLSFVTSHPKTQAILAAIQRDPASVQFALTDDGDGLLVSILTGSQLAARGASILRFAQTNRGAYAAARKAGKI